MAVNFLDLNFNGNKYIENSWKNLSTQKSTLILDQLLQYIVQVDFGNCVRKAKAFDNFASSIVYEL